MYALMQAILRTTQAMISNDGTFKLFGKFEQPEFQREIIEQQKPQQTTQSTPSSLPHRHETNSMQISNGNSLVEHDVVHRLELLPIGICIFLSFLAGLIAGLFSLEQLINLLSVGTIFMFYTLTLNVFMNR